MMVDLFKTLSNETHPHIKCSKQPTAIHKGVDSESYLIEVPQGELVYFPQFIRQRVADRTLDVLFENDRYDWHNTDWHQVKDFEAIQWTNIAWKQNKIHMYGKTIKLPRVSAWYGDPNKNYRYSGIQLYANPWIPALTWLKTQIEQASQTTFNSVLLNWYRDGQDHISWHTDAEKELGENPVIASLNFGESRRFILRENADHNNKIEILLSHGDLLIMRGALQHFWQHAVPKQSKVKSGRLNMTFRKIL